MSIIRNNKIISKHDGLELAMTIVIPETPIKGAIILSHGMAEHRLRYLDFMKVLAENGYLAVIHDHRGHGESIQSKADYGYFYEEGMDGIISDLGQVIEEVKKEYPNIPYYLFSHSMGTLVARCYIQKHDQEINKLIMSGPPAQNKMVGLGKFMVHLMMCFHNSHYRSKLLQKLTFGGYSKRFKNDENKAWVCSNIEEVKKYEKSENCGFIFTLNGFKVLYYLLDQTYKKSYEVKNPELPILILAGSDDPVIGTKETFPKIKEFLESQGYQNIQTKLYEGKRHEILLEDNRKEVYEDILNFLNE